MKKLVIVLFLFLPLAVLAQQKPDVYVFTSPTCVHCGKFKKEYYPKLKNKYDKKVNFLDLSTAEESNNLKLADLAEKYGKGAYVPALVVGEHFLLGYPNQIGLYAEEAIEKALAANAVTVELAEVDARAAFEKFTLAAIIFNGLIDGVNPCAFAVIVFFISFLSVYGYNRKEVIYVGGAYCLAVFLTYIMLGLGLFNVLYAMESFHLAIKIFYILTAAVCFIFFALSVYDFIMYRKTKDGKSMLLRLPDNLKVRINKIIGFFLRDKEKSALRLVCASLAVGFIVSLVEAVCTGQVYIPTIVLIMKEPAFRLRAWLYLLIYNIMFILPLLAVFVLAAAGQKSETINNFFKNHLGAAKILLSLVFLCLGLMLAFNI
ncbi:MAG: hypothetical protein LBG46_06860 [Elusimicrobiota bacterium]|jgi:hypothetical protein|nr:hypothetical protein [Elusimicrobiota bacterium]